MIILVMATRTVMDFPALIKHRYLYLDYHTYVAHHSHCLFSAEILSSRVVENKGTVKL